MNQILPQSSSHREQMLMADLQVCCAVSAVSAELTWALLWLEPSDVSVEAPYSEACRVEDAFEAGDCISLIVSSLESP